MEFLSLTVREQIVRGIAKSAQSKAEVATGRVFWKIQASFWEDFINIYNTYITEYKTLP